MSPPRDSLPPERLYALAETLLYAESSGTFLEPPSLSDGLTLEDAYRLGAVIAESRIDRGWRCRGWKVGFTNRRIWSKWGLDQPIVGPVYAETMFVVGTGGGAASADRPVGVGGRGEADRPGPALRVPAGRRAALMIEVEVVFGFDRPPPSADGTPVPDWAALGAELVDCHYRGWRLHPADAVADFGLHAGLVVGPRIGPMDAGAVARLRDLSASLSAGGKRLAEGRGRAVLDGPANVLAELHGPLAERIAGYGVGLSPAGPGAGAADRTEGYLVSTGTLTPLVEARIGTTYEVEADLLPSFSFSLV